jgi:hypothetical protein
MAAKAFDKELTKLRGEIERLRTERNYVLSSPLPKADMKAHIEAAVQQTSANAGGRLDLLLRGMGNPEQAHRAHAWREIFTARSLGAKTNEDPTIQTSLADVLVWLAGPDLLRWLHAKVDAAEYVPGPPMNERAARLEAIRESLRTLERQEEALIVEAEGEGVYIGRRADASPEIVLEYDPKGSLQEFGPTRMRFNPDADAAAAAAAGAGQGHQSAPAGQSAAGATGMRGPAAGSRLGATWGRSR